MLGKIKLGISIGDPNGIGIEIILKIFEDRRLFEFFTPLIFGPIKLLENQKKHFFADCFFFFHFFFLINSGHYNPNLVC